MSDNIIQFPSQRKSRSKNKKTGPKDKKDTSSAKGSAQNVISFSPSKQKVGGPFAKTSAKQGGGSYANPPATKVGQKQVLGESDLANTELAESKTGHLIKWTGQLAKKASSSEKPYVFVGTGLSFLFVAGVFITMSQKQGPSRYTAGNEDYHSSIRIIKEGMPHSVSWYKTKRGRMAVNLIPVEPSAEDKRELSSTSPKKSAKTLGPDEQKTSERGLASNPKNLKQILRAQERKALLKIKLGQSKLIRIGRSD